MCNPTNPSLPEEGHDDLVLEELGGRLLIVCDRCQTIVIDDNIPLYEKV